MKNILCVIMLALVWPLTATAQPDMIVEHYTQEEGLPSNTVYSALKDRDGFMWFGTWHGLCSFDGAKFAAYTSRWNHLSDVPPQKVRNLVEDSDGYLWIRNTDNHLYLFDKAAESYHDVYNDLKRMSRNVQVIKIQRSPSGRVVILTRNKDIFEASATGGGKVAVAKIFDSRNCIDASTMKLRRNVLGENSEYVYWLSTRLDVCVIPKKAGRKVLGSLAGAGEFSSFRHSGRYLCVGTAEGEIHVIDVNTGNARKYVFQDIKTPVTSVNLLAGRIYFTTSSGLYSLMQGSQPRLVVGTTGGATISFIDKYGKLWLCSKGGTMVCHDPVQDRHITFAMPGDSLFADMKFVDTGANGLFILQRNGDVWRFDHKTGNVQNVNLLREFKDDVSDTHFFDIDIDDSGIMWLSSTTSGVFKVCFPKYSFRFLFPDMIAGAAESLPASGRAGRPDMYARSPYGSVPVDNGVRAVYQTRGGDLWVGTRDGGLYCVDVKTQRVKRRFGAGDIGVVYHIMEDKGGTLWFSTKGAGLVAAVPDALAPQGLRLTRYTNRRGDPGSISSNRVYYTYQDSKGRIWACTFYGGLNLIERRGSEIVFLNKRNGMKGYPKYELYTDVRSVTEDRNGRFWVATTDGLMSFDGNFKSAAGIKFETYRGSGNPGIINNDIYTMFKDSRGDIWLGIFGNGLKRIESYDKGARRPVLKSFTVNERQGGNVITSITEDKDHCLWIGTENGLASLKPGSTLAKSYDRFAGFPNVTVEDNTSECLQDGRILIGCRQGLLVFNPATVLGENETRHNTFIVDFKVNNRDLEDFDPPIYSGSVKYAERITLRHDQSTFTIEFASPHYAGNGTVPYAYILDGYEEQWHENGGNRMASYANVPPGHYEFRVKVDDDVSPERVIEVVVLPPWWATWWARAIYVIIGLLALYGIARTVVYVIRMRNEVYINDRLAELKIRFFTNVSHELRTPLSLIKGPVEELKANEKLSPSGREYLDLIERNSRKMLQLVNQILDFRKIQNGKMKLHVSLVDVTAMIETLMGEFKVLAGERDISFTFEHPSERVTAWCDAEKIGVVLNNLINNAFKYTDDGGSICVALAYNNGVCTICVEDDGAGIPKSQLGLIFERFSQADNKTSGDTAYAGTGIGLSLSKEYVNMHHGRIWADNMEGGRGVAFTVELPTDKEHFNDRDIEVYFDDHTAENDIMEDDGVTVMNPDDGVNADVPTMILIEDNADMCRMLKLQLSGRYNVFTARDGNEGLKKIYQYHPDIIVSDLMMPGMNGLDVLRSVRQDFNISHIPVIILTAKNTDEDKMAAVKAGANAFIPKPFSSNYLVARVNQLLDEQRIFQRKMVVQAAVDNGGSEDSGDEYEQHLVKKDLEFIHQINAIIENNLNSNDFNIDTIAGTIGLSRSAFFKKLKSLTGFAPVDLVREIRLGKAARLIESTDDSITEIAYSVGFRDVGYFGKCFKKKYGKSPKEYRKDLKNTVEG